MILIEDEAPSGPRPVGVPAQGLAEYVESFPALLWRIEISRSRIEYLNTHELPSLGRESGLFMKSAEFRHRVLVAEDAPRMEEFMRAMLRGEHAQVIVRVATRDRVCRMKAACWMHPHDLRYHLGYLIDLPDLPPARDALLESESELSQVLEHLDAPALILDLESQRVLAANAGAGRLFQRPARELARMRLADITHRSMAHLLRGLDQELLESGRWTGHVLLAGRLKAVFPARADIRLLRLGGRRLGWMVLTPEETGPAEVARGRDPEPPRPGHDGQAFQAALAERLDGLTAMDDILRVFQETQLPSHRFDAVMFSDIQASRNRVVVYAAGEPFAAMEQGARHPYEGTIAQDIERYRLDHLIMDDTLGSIKAIDWALFIPKGIRSYFAQPFHQRGVLRAVLILCSLKPSAFPASGLEEYSLLFEPFRAAIQAWRTANRRSRRP